jgi:hypothetical protein
MQQQENRPLVLRSRGQFDRRIKQTCFLVFCREWKRETVREKGNEWEVYKKTQVIRLLPLGCWVTMLRKSGVRREESEESGVMYKRRYTGCSWGDSREKIRRQRDVKVEDDKRCWECMSCAGTNSYVDRSQCTAWCKKSEQISARERSWSGKGCLYWIQQITVYVQQNGRRVITVLREYMIIVVGERTDNDLSIKKLVQRLS